MISPPQNIIIWEKSIYYHVEDKGWSHAPLQRLEDAVAIIQEHCKRRSKIAFIYDPDILQTEFAECPMGGRNIVREVLSSTHESVANPHTAWGYQAPWPLSASSGGSQGTFCSYETAPNLYLLNKTLGDLGYTVTRAFPMASLASQAGMTPGRTSILLTVDLKRGQAFVYLFTANGLRACRKLYGAGRADYDLWAEISLVFGEYGITFEDGGQRPSIRIYQAPGTDAKTQCPYWDVISRQAQVELLGMGSLAALMQGVPVRHSSSLLTDLPRTVRLDLGFQVAGAVLAAALLGFGIYAYLDLGKEKTELKALGKKEAGQIGEKNLLLKNKNTIETLRTLYSQDIFEFSKGRLAIVNSLPAAIPRNATLLSLSAGVEKESHFRLQGVFWNQNTGASRKPGGARMGPTTANTSTPMTGITSYLETNIKGLLVDQKNSKFLPSGDFAIEGNTPMPEFSAASKGQASNQTSARK